MEEDWSLFASGLEFLEHFGPWLLTLDEFEKDIIDEIKLLEQYSSAAMMDTKQKTIESAWTFNILQFCAPGKFGELQGLIDSGLQTESVDSLIVESKSSFATLCQTSTELAFDAAFLSIRKSINSLCKMDFWTKEQFKIVLRENSIF